MFAQTHAETCRAQLAAILVRAEVAVVEVLGEMNVAEGVSAADGELIVMPGEPAQHFAPFALAMIAVRVMSESKTAGNGKVMAMVIQVAMPALRQQVKGGGIKSRRYGIAGKAAGKSKAFQRVEFKITAI